VRKEYIQWLHDKGQVCLIMKMLLFREVWYATLPQEQVGYIKRFVFIKKLRTHA